MSAFIRKYALMLLAIVGIGILPVNAAEAKEGFTICNQADQHIDVAFGYYSGGQWKSKGWYGVARGTCKDINWRLSSGNYYVYGNGNGGSTWGDNYMFCTNRKAFTISGDKNCHSRGYTKSGFSKIEIKPGIKHFTYTLTGGSKPAKRYNSVISGLDIGDSVYVQGWFSDELVQVIRIDRSDNTVKVRRRYDGTTTWVNASKIITREQSTANDVGRTVVAVAAIACLFSPECGR